MRQRFIQEAAALGARAEVRTSRTYEAFALPEDAPLCRLAAAAVAAAGLRPSFAPTGGGSDANVFNAHGIAAVNLGLGYEGNHSPVERIRVQDLVAATRVVAALLTLPEEAGG